LAAVCKRCVTVQHRHRHCGARWRGPREQLNGDEMLRSAFVLINELSDARHRYCVGRQSREGKEGADVTPASARTLEPETSLVGTPRTLGRNRASPLGLPGRLRFRLFPPRRRRRAGLILPNTLSKATRHVCCRGLGAGAPLEQERLKTSSTHAHGP
jgi:hypothetical protein